MVEVEIYTFACGQKVFRYTDALLPVTYAGQTYAGSVIKRGSVLITQDLEKSTLDITAPLTLPVLDLFRPFAVLRKVLVNVQRVTRAGVLVRPVFSGALGNIDSDTHVAKLTVQSRFAAQLSHGLRRKWQKSCPHVLYSPYCGAFQTDFAVPATVSSVSGRTVSAAAFASKPDGWFNGGMLQTTAAGDKGWLFITAHTGDTVTLLTTPNVHAGQVIDAFPGCDHTTGPNGHARFFDNADTFGGQPYIPIKNPVGGSKLY